MLPNKTSDLFKHGEFPSICKIRGRKTLEVDQVYIKEMLPNGKPWNIFYISRWSLSFLERLKCLFTGRLYVIVGCNPHLKGSAPIHPSVSFIEPKLHKVDPFEDTRNKMVEQTEALVKKSN